MLLISLIVVSLTVTSEFTNEEKKAFFILQCLYSTLESKEKAADVIKTLLRLNRVNKSKDPGKEVKRFVLFTKLSKDINNFRVDYKYYFESSIIVRISNSYHLPADEILTNFQERIE